MNKVEALDAMLKGETVEHVKHDEVIDTFWFDFDQAQVMFFSERFNEYLGCCWQDFTMDAEFRIKRKPLHQEHFILGGEKYKNTEVIAFINELAFDPIFEGKTYIVTVKEQ
ncbi:MAG: hypothetical protein EHM87_24670 [Burkholderiales bacterium]|nr:MAG: hypothetical protein EHM87_24670 [Burkholderiales bacterium]